MHIGPAVVPQLETCGKRVKRQGFSTVNRYFSTFSARALSGYLVYRFLLGRVNFPFQRWLSFPGLFFGKQGIAQWWERSPPTVARVRIPASTPYACWVCCWFSYFPLSSKTDISKFQFDQDSSRRGTTLWMCYLQILIYLFMFTVPLMRMTDLLNRLFNF